METKCSFSENAVEEKALSKKISKKKLIIILLFTVCILGLIICNLIFDVLIYNNISNTKGAENFKQEVTMSKDKDEILKTLENLQGDIGFYYKDLSTGEEFGYNQNKMFEAASVIKLPIYASIMKLYSENKLELLDVIKCREEDKLPSCGALQFFTGEVDVDINTLCSLMITISDNTATNLLIKHIGIDTLNNEFKNIGFKDTHIERLLFDSRASAKGLENKIVLSEIAQLLEKIYNHSFISEEISVQMENLLLKQQINHKIPGYLPEDIQVAHKTGEDSTITNDVAIVYGDSPCIICFASNNTDVPQAEKAIREISFDLVCK